MRFAMSPRNVGAALGLLAAAVTCTIVISRLVDAATPAATRLRLINETPAALVVEGLMLSGQPLSAAAVQLPAALNPAAAAEWESKPVLLAPGLAIEVSGRLAAQTPQSICKLEARPQGLCSIRARFKTGEAATCDYDCKAKAPAP
jgi:hypothetical protein